MVRFLGRWAFAALVIGLTACASMPAPTKPALAGEYVPDRFALPLDLGAKALAAAPWCAGRYFFPREREALALNPNVRRSGGRLALGAPARIVLVNTGDDAEAETEVFTYAGRYPGTSVHLVHVQYYEGDGWRLFDLATGTQAETSQPPIPSPDARRLVSVSGAEAYNFNGVEVVERTPAGLKNSAQLEISNGMPCFVRWRGSDGMDIRIQAWDGSRDGSPATVVRSGIDWRLERRD